MLSRQKVIMMGATGAVGSQVVKQLLYRHSALEKLSLLGRRQLDIEKLSNGGDLQKVAQHEVDIFHPSTYSDFIEGHTTAICTLGVGQPSKMSKEQWLRIDKVAVFDFAKACKQNGVQHFQILTSVGTSPKSPSFYLRGKGELEEDLEQLNFSRLSIFQPSMIITPNNRYGLGQAITLALWPALSKLMFGSLSKYRGVDVNVLGQAMANSLFDTELGVIRYEWSDFQQLIENS
jgi:uncharacterized protein YbjT (DUF2867 family)